MGPFSKEVYKLPETAGKPESLVIAEAPDGLRLAFWQQQRDPNPALLHVLAVDGTGKVTNPGRTFAFTGMMSSSLSALIVGRTPFRFVTGASGVGVGIDLFPLQADGVPAGKLTVESGE